MVDPTDSTLEDITVVPQLPIIIHKTLLQLIWRNSIKQKEKESFSLVSKQWFNLMSQVHCRNDSRSTFEYYLDTEHPASFQDRLISDYNLTKDVYILNVLKSPESGRSKRESSQQRKDLSEQEQALFDSRCFGKLKLLVISSSTINSPLFPRFIKHLHTVQSSQRKHSLNKLMIQLGESITDESIEALELIAPYITKISVISRWAIDSSYDQHINFIHFMNRLPKLRKMVIDLHPELIKILFGETFNLKCLDKVDINTEFAKESDIPWSILNNVRSLRHFSCSLASINTNFIDFLVSNTTITHLISALPTTNVMCKKIGLQSSLVDLTLKLTVDHQLLLSNESPSILPSNLKALTVLHERDESENIFSFIMENISSHNNLESLAIAKSSLTMKATPLGFALAHNKSVKHLTFTNLYGDCPEGMNTIIEGLAKNSVIETVTFFVNLNMEIFQRLFKMLEEHQTLYKVICNRKSIPQKYKFSKLLLDKYEVKVDSSLIQITKIN